MWVRSMTRTPVSGYASPAGCCLRLLSTAMENRLSLGKEGVESLLKIGTFENLAIPGCRAVHVRDLPRRMLDHFLRGLDRERRVLGKLQGEGRGFSDETFG